MSIYLTPIPEEIRRSLHEREESLKKSSVNKSASNTITRDGSDPSYTFYPLGTVYIKLFSPVKTDSMPDGAMLMGGEMSKEDNVWKMKHGFDEMYTSPQFDSTGKNAKVQNNPFRPMPGIEGLDVSYKGGMRAIREGTIKWSCFSLEDLDRLTPHFLSIGKSVLVEWGWVDAEVLKNSFDMNEFMDLDASKLYKRMKKKILDSKGNLDMMRGVIKNFEWQLREDGGFDCTTNIVSMGVNITGASTKSEIQCDYEPIVKNDGKTVVLKPKVNLNTYIKTLNTQLKKYVQNKTFSDRGIVYFTKEGTLFRGDADVGPYVTWGWMEDNILSKFLGKVGKAEKDSKGNYSGNENEVLAQIRSISTRSHKSVDGALVKESIIIGNHKALLTPNRRKFILPGQWPADTLVKTGVSDVKEALNQTLELEAMDGVTERVGKAWDEGDGYSGAIKDVGTEIFDTMKESLSEVYGDVKNMVEVMIAGAGDSFDEEATRELATIVKNNFTKDNSRFAVDKDNWTNGGYLRNILLHWEFIRDCFQNADTIEAGLKTMFSKMNDEVNNLWDFQVVNSPDDERIVQVVDRNFTTRSVKQLLDSKSKLDFNSGKATGDLFEFKVWTEGSLVSAQNMTSRVPSAMAVSAMYGSNKQTPEEGGADDNVTGGAIGNMSSDKSDQSIYPVAAAWKFPNFGNSYEDPNKDLTLTDGPPLGEIEFETDEEEQKRNVDAGTTTQDTDKTGATDQQNQEDFLKMIQGFSEQSQTRKSIPVHRHIYDEDGVMKKRHKEIMKSLITLVPPVDPEAKTQPKKYQDALLPIDLSLSMDGIGGILPGHAFTTSFIPVRYRKTVVFQVKDINHKITADGWDVDIVGQIRLSQTILNNVVTKQEKEAKQ